MAALAQMHGRVAWIDFVKGVGILLVVFGHVWRGCAGAGLAIDPALYALVDRGIYLFHMPLFFCLAGLFLERSLSGRSLARYAAERCEHLIYPLLVWSYLSAAFRVLAGGAANRGGLSMQGFLLYPFEANDIFWFLWALFLIQVALAAGLRGPLGRARPLFFGLVGAGLAVVATGLSLPVVGTALHYLPYVALGYAARGLVARRLGAAAGAGGLALFVGAQMLALAHAPEGLAGFALASAAVLGAVLALAALHGRLGNTALARGIAALGALSMPVYLAHVIALAGARAALLRLGVTDLGAHLAAGCLAGVAMPLVVHALAVRLGGAALLGFDRFPRRSAGPRGAAQGSAPA